MDKNYTILLVEDDENDALLLRRAFKNSGVTNPVKWLRNGWEAVQYLEGNGDYFDRKNESSPKVIILDLKMPLMSGMELLKYLQEHPKVKVIPTVVLSSSRLPEDIEGAYARGAQTYFVKPTDFESLTKLLKAFLHYWDIGEKFSKT